VEEIFMMIMARRIVNSSLEGILVMSSLLDQYRAEKNEFFHYDPGSPLSKAQKKEFQGLNYYPENPDLAFEARLELLLDQEPVEMQTTGGDTQAYYRYGRFRFSVDGQEALLNVYANEEGGFFLPFVDSAAGVETYAAGRYLEPELLSANLFRVDFNLAYNPYCAYNDAWSCPLTPSENRLKVAIRAGEKIFHE
jgi:uncharacterized protein